MLLNTVASVFLAAGLATAYENTSDVHPMVTDVWHSSPILKRQPGFDFGSEKVRGVNVGGWLVLEPYVPGHE